VGFDLADFLRGQPFQFEPIGHPPCIQPLEQWLLFRAGGDNQFAADLVGNRVRSAELDHGLVALAGKTGFETARPVVDAGMDDPAVPPGLVSGPPGFLLEQGQARFAFPPRECPGHGQSHNATPHHRIIKCLHMPPSNRRPRRMARGSVSDKANFEIDVQRRGFLVH
jgi:hypothetical protein